MEALAAASGAQQESKQVTAESCGGQIGATCVERMFYSKYVDLGTCVDPVAVSEESIYVLPRLSILTTERWSRARTGCLLKILFGRIRRTFR